MPKPVVLVSSNFTDDLMGTPGHTLRDTYVCALRDVTGCTPLILPTVGADFRLDDVMSFAQGIVLAGADSNICPSHYGEERLFDSCYLDRNRDDMTLPLLRAAIAADIPVFAICRGFQELNVACGGSLHQFIHKQPGKACHKLKKDLTMLENFQNHAHRMETQKGGLFEQWNMPATFYVNSLHAQGVNRVGAGLHVEGLSDDGVVEAVSMPGKRFVLGVQWHPEGDCFINDASHILFERFGEALRAFSAKN